MVAEDDETSMPFTNLTPEQAQELIADVVGQVLPFGVFGVGRRAERVRGDMAETTAHADPEWADAVLEEPEVVGVESLGAENVTLRVSTKVKPGQKVAFARELRARIGRRLQREGLLETDLAPRRPIPES